MFTAQISRPFHPPFVLVRANLDHDPIPIDELIPTNLFVLVGANLDHDPIPINKLVPTNLQLNVLLITKTAAGWTSTKTTKPQVAILSLFDLTLAKSNLAMMEGG